MGCTTFKNCTVVQLQMNITITIPDRHGRCLGCKSFNQRGAALPATLPTHRRLTPKTSDKCCLDSGATSHMLSNRKRLTSIVKSTNIFLDVPQSNYVPITSIGLYYSL